MRFSPWLPALAWLGFLALLPACSRPERCPVVPGTRYEGEGIVVLRENVAQDGSMFVLFSPCATWTRWTCYTRYDKPPKVFSFPLTKATF